MSYLIQENHSTDTEECQQMLLNNEKFGWKDAKHKNTKLEDLLRSGGNTHRADQAKMCSYGLEFNFLDAEDDGSNLEEAVKEGRKQLSSGMFCQMRVCPICNARRSAKLAVMLSECIQKVKSAHSGVRFIFLTLTLRNVKKEDLSDCIDQIMKAYHRLINRRVIKRAVKGVFRTLEITYNASQDSYHPHLHLLVAVEGSEYFGTGYGGKYYISQKEWRQYWQEAMRLDYDPSVYVCAADTHNWGKVSAELTKYAVKDTDYLKVAERYGKRRGYEVVSTFMDALYKRRLVQASGWFKDFWNTEDEEDLMHLEGDGEKHSLYYGQYKYSFKTFRDYFLETIYMKDENGNLSKILYESDDEN